MKKYSKKVTVSLTDEDFLVLSTMAEDDRRTINQMASMIVEDVIIKDKTNVAVSV